MSNYSYTAVPNAIQPGVAQAPFASYNTNPQGSPFATQYGYNETELLRRDIAMAIYNSTPKAYEAMKTILNKPVEYNKDDVFTYEERGIGRAPVKLKTAYSSAGITGSLICYKGAATVGTINKVLQLPNGAKCIVTGVTVNSTDDTLAVASMTGETLPAIDADTIMPIQMGLIADGLNFNAHYDRLFLTSRNNYIQLFQRDHRWTRMELQKYQNLGTTNYLDEQKMLKTELIFQDMFISMFAGKKGEFMLTIPSTGNKVPAKTTDGLFTIMQDAGSWHASTSEATLVTDFEQGAFATDYLVPGSTRFIYGTSENLYKLSRVWKEPGIQYRPDDSIGNLNLQEYRIGQQRFVPVPVEVFKEPSMFTSDWAKRLLVVDNAAITPTCMLGYMPFEMGQTNPKGVNGSIQDYQDFWVQGMLGLKYNNPLGGFWMDFN